jgi:phosphoribosylformimino-5-aminoimidazole carboxamide ribotide isomerase
VIVFPAIDILGGKAVRLRQGRYDEVTVYNDSPVAQAKTWRELGAEWIHVVDLDGARSGVPENLAHVAAIASAVDVPIQVGGGVRTRETIDALVAAGVARVVLGTKLVTEPEFAAEASAAWGDRIVAGVDARDGKVAIEGWRTGTARDVSELFEALADMGLVRVVYTDIAVDGTREGIDAEAYRALVDRYDLSVVASGGVASLEDIRALAAVGGRLEGVIVGSALYEGLLTLPEAIQAGRGA